MSKTEGKTGGASIAGRGSFTLLLGLLDLGPWPSVHNLPDLQAQRRYQQQTERVSAMLWQMISPPGSRTENTSIRDIAAAAAGTGGRATEAVLPFPCVFAAFPCVFHSPRRGGPSPLFRSGSDSDPSAAPRMLLPHPQVRVIGPTLVALVSHRAVAVGTVVSGGGDGGGNRKQSAPSAKDKTVTPSLSFTLGSAPCFVNIFITAHRSDTRAD